METGPDSEGVRPTGFRVFLLAAALIVLLAGSFRAVHIGERSLWLDEAIAANISRGTMTETIELTRGLHSAPIVHPLILYAVEKVRADTLAVRLPSLVASVLAVLVLLCLAPLPSIGYRAAVLAALMLAISAAQIRYAQEVREYSLSVLYAAVLTYFYLLVRAYQKTRMTRVLLYLLLFGAPLVQYGLALFGAAVLAAMAVLWLADARPRIGLSQLMVATGFFAAGCALTILLTLRYQWGEPAAYLTPNYPESLQNIPRFAVSATRHLLAFLLPGAVAAWLSAAAVAGYLFISIRERTYPPLVVLGFASFGAVLFGAVLHVYPYGPIRQCLFLAPVASLLASVSLVHVADRWAGRMNNIAIATIMGIVIVSGIVQIRAEQPYREIEDIKAILGDLQKQAAPGDSVYVYSGAVPAVDFYLKVRDDRYIYGDFHRDEPERYAAEIRGGLRPGAERFWLVFSHVYQDEDQRILRDLAADWDVSPVHDAVGSALYMASRRAIGAPGAATGRDPTDVTKGSDTVPRSVISGRSGDTFWDWNLRNSRLQSR